MTFLAARISDKHFPTNDKMVLGVPLSGTFFHYLLWKSTLHVGLPYHLLRVIFLKGIYLQRK